MRQPKCTPNAQTDGGDRSLGMIYLPDKIDLNMARNTCSNLAQIDLTLGVWRVWHSTFWSHGRAVDPTGDEKLSNRRLSQFDPYGTRFQLFIFEAPAVIPNGQTGSTFST